MNEFPKIYINLTEIVGLRLSRRGSYPSRTDRCYMLLSIDLVKFVLLAVWPPYLVRDTNDRRPASRHERRAPWAECHRPTRGGAA